jgi:uncharacterized membrane protein YjjB (DUF3815 family)
MRHLGAPRWVVVAALALGSYVIALLLDYLWMSSAYATSELGALIIGVALYGGLAFGLPTVLLMLLLLVRRVAVPVAALAAVWMAVNAILWLPVQPALAAWAAAVAAGVFAAILSRERPTPRDA